MDFRWIKHALSVLSVWLAEALQCYTCMGSTDEDCNRQGSKACPSYSDACAIIKGDGSKFWFLHLMGLISC